MRKSVLTFSRGLETVFTFSTVSRHFPTVFLSLHCFLRAVLFSLLVLYLILSIKVKTVETVETVEGFFTHRRKSRRENQNTFHFPEGLFLTATFPLFPLFLLLYYYLTYKINGTNNFNSSNH